MRGDELIADFEGSSQQVKGAINSSPSFAKSCVYLTVRSILETDVPNNAGYFRPITVLTPPGTIVNPNLPAAFATRGLTGFRLIDTMFGALAQIRPDRVAAACEGGNTGATLGGWDREQGPFIFVELVCGTGGARPGLDAVDGNTNPGVCMCNVPCEVVEGESRELPSKVTMTMRHGDVLHHTQPGGGGYGDSLARDPARVLDDVLDEKLTPEYAQREYGVVLHADSRTVDQEATRRRRMELRESRRDQPGGGS